MPNYAIHDGSTVSNVIIADSLGIAESVSGDLSVVETEGEPWIGWTLHGDEWRPPTPFPSWEWIDGEWVAPVPCPPEPGAWVWDEDAQDWVDTTPPETPAP